MFGKALQFRAKAALLIAGVALFLMGSLSMLQQVARHGDTMSLPGCALMAQGHGADQHICAMDALTHFANLQSMLSGTAPLLATLIILSLIALAFAAGVWLFLKHTLQTEASAYVVARLLAPQRNLRLQEAFSRGILHSKTYER